MLSLANGDTEVVGFALSGGGSRSASQVGALKALTEVGIWPDLLAGSSAGAVNAAWFALHPHELDQHEAIWLTLRRQDVFPGGWFRILINMARQGYVHAANAWEGYVRRKFGTACFEDLHVPCAVLAVSVTTGRRVVFDSGEIAPAIMASTAIPGVFPPYRIGDELYVDGGVLDFMPIRALLERKATTIFALDCSFFTTDPDSPASLVDRCARISATRDVYQSMSLAVAQGCSVHLLRPQLPEITDGRDFHHTAEFVRIGYDHACRYLETHLRPVPASAVAEPQPLPAELPLGNAG